MSLRSIGLGAALVPLCVVAFSAGCSQMRNALNRPARESERLQAESQKAHASGDVVEAARLLAEAAALTPDNADLHKKLAHLLLEQGSKEQAAEQFALAAKLLPDDAHGRIALARVCLDLGDIRRAEEAADAALAVDPTLIEALEFRARLSEEQWLDDEAIEYCYRILAIEPSHVAVRLQIARIHLRAAHPERATPVLRSICSARDVSPEHKARAQQLLGVAYGQQQRWADASSALTAAMNGRENPPAEEWYRLAYARFRDGDRAGCSGAVAKALAAQPDHGAALALSEVLRASAYDHPDGVLPAGFTAPGVVVPVEWARTVPDEVAPVSAEGTDGRQTL